MTTLTTDASADVTPGDAGPRPPAPGGRAAAAAGPASSRATAAWSA